MTPDTYCRPIDERRKLMVAISPHRYVNARSAFKLGLIARRPKGARRGQGPVTADVPAPAPASRA